MSLVCVQNIVKSAAFASKPWIPFTCPVRWARYGNLYLEPTLSPEELAKPMPEDDLRRYQPIKAARNDQSTSLNYDPLVQKFVSILIIEGKKDTAREVLAKTFAKIKLLQLERYNKAKTEEAKQDIELDPHMIFHQAVENCRPLLITQKVRRGGVIYTVPIPVKPNYQQHKALTWLRDSSLDKDDNERIWNRMARELIEAAKNEGRSVRKKQELHKLCEANRAYAHFRW